MTEARNSALARRLDRLAETQNGSPLVLVGRRAVLDATPGAAEFLSGEVSDDFIVVWDSKRYRLTAALVEKFSQAGIPLRLPLPPKVAPRIALHSASAEVSPREATRPAPTPGRPSAKPPHYASYKQRILAQEAIQQAEVTKFSGVIST